MNDGITYSSLGVNIDKGDRFARYISGISSPALTGIIGGFAGGIDIDTERYENPVLYSTTDGVGTKLLVARALNHYSSIGIDLVAMCVNDLIVCNVEPLTFLDYIACGALQEEILKKVIKGIVKGCEEAECVLAGGETAEMPDLYGKDDIDLAGFCVGIGDRDKVLPLKKEISKGDRLYGLPSSGIHSNGLSLARKVIPPDNRPLMNELLIPTKIYIKEMKILLSSGLITGAAHITGGGLEGNIQRILPVGCHAVINYEWPVPSIFREIQERGPVSPEEMKRVFNLGIGIAFIVKKGTEEEFQAIARANNINIYEIGIISDG
jgi:phosphoribosylformylglycinamidine cyclo-ligase